MSDATLEFAITLARQAGQLLRDGLSQQRQIDLKSPYELVTDIDRASEALIVAAIRARFPGHAILAEEGGGEYAAARPTWLIDPLDGTNNFAHGFPFFAVSLALWAEQCPLLGVIYDPLRDELFAAQAGAGAHCNDRRMHVSGVATLGAALVSTGFAYDYAERADNNLGQFDRVQARCQGVRRAGAAALDLAYLAMGRLDAHWEIAPLLTVWSQYTSQDRDRRDWTLRHSASWTPLQGGSVLLSLQANDYQDSRIDQLRRGGGASVDWQARPRLFLSAGVEKHYEKFDGRISRPLSFQARGYWTF